MGIVAIRRAGFTLIELLVVIAIIALLISILLPSLASARISGWSAVGGNNERQLVIAAASYSHDYKEWFNPIQDEHVGEQGWAVEGTWRVYLYEYMSNAAGGFDSPGEKNERYADGCSDYDVSVSNGQVKKPDPYAIGRVLKEEMYNVSGIGANLVHYWGGDEGKGPFGRPFISSWGKAKHTQSGYPEGLTMLSEVQDPTHLILFGDGGSSSPKLWPEDAWWIYKIDEPVRGAGFSRYQQNLTYGTDHGAFRYFGKANYAFADGSVRLLDSRDIPCNSQACWWSVRLDPHPDK